MGLDIGMVFHPFLESTPLPTRVYHLFDASQFAKYFYLHPPNDPTKDEDSHHPLFIAGGTDAQEVR